MKTKLDQKAGRADVADITAYRAHKFTATERAKPSFAVGNQRIEDARRDAVAQFDALHSPAIAYASVLLSRDGSITLSASGVEPEFAPAIGSALLALRDRINSHAASHRPRPRGYGGFANLMPVISIAFMAATYLNEVAWVDAALSFAAQITVGYALSLTQQRRQLDT